MLAPDFEYRTERLSIYARIAPADRPDLLGRIYLEAFEKVPGGIAHNNGWIAPSPSSLREFFADLSMQSIRYVSARPYRLGQACDGTIGAPVMAAFSAACNALGLIADDLYRQAYPQEHDHVPDWANCRLDADWQGGVAWPEKWDDAAIAGLIESLTEINYHRLVEVLETALETRTTSGLAKESNITIV